MGASAALVLVLSACATATSTSRAPLTPQAVAEMEARSTREPGNVDARVELAAAYLRTGRNQESARLLEGVVAAPQPPAAASYFLGVAYEALDRSTDARRAYDAYLQRGSSDQLKRLVRGRLALMDRRDLEQAVRASLAREQQIGPNAAAARVVGVFPFLSTAGPTLTPLSRAFAELLSTDLDQTDRLTVVERSQVQFLLDEIQLAEAGAVDPQTAARAGR
ncbi:MAG: tetratricopeptide repeat protein, partial [Longimicrobiales bacterium]